MPRICTPPSTRVDVAHLARRSRPGAAAARASLRRAPARAPSRGSRSSAERYAPSQRNRIAAPSSIEPGMRHGCPVSCPRACPTRSGCPAGNARVAPLRCTKPRLRRAVGQDERLLLHEVVRDLVVDLARHAEHVLERLLHAAHDDVAVGDGVVRRASCGAPSTRGRAARRRAATSPRAGSSAGRAARRPRRRSGSPSASRSRASRSGP